MQITDSARPIWHKGAAGVADGGGRHESPLFDRRRIAGTRRSEGACQAFDNAWANIAARYKTPNATEAARMRLVSLVADTKDASEMQAIAVQEMTKGE